MGAFEGMAMADQEIICPMCGFKNPADAGRCRSCGAKVEELVTTRTAEEEHARRYQQDDFEWKWALAASAVYMTIQAVILIALPMVISSFDPQGIKGLLLSVVVWFVGGIVVGVVSPGKTFIEPAVGALIAAPPTLIYLAMTTPEGFQPTPLAYVVTAMLGIMIALFGAFIGEKIQMTTRGDA